MTYIHSRIDEVDKLEVLRGSAAQLNYRMPGEFEPVDAVWLAYPHNQETWPTNLQLAQQEYDYFVCRLRHYTKVELLRPKLSFPTNDAWIRDYGPIFVKNHRGELACHDFIFNGWGGKYGGHTAYACDDIIPQQIAKQLQIPIWIHDFVLEGGSIDVNGQGVLLTTAQCLLHSNRNPSYQKAAIGAYLQQTLGVQRIIWLPGGIHGDDTDGHVDDIARFVDPSTIVAVRAPQNHVDYEMLERNWSVLQNAVDQKNYPFTCVALPTPTPLCDPTTGFLLPASYANFLLVNNAIFVPTFAQATDEQALRIFEQVLPGYHIEAIPCCHLIIGLGALHCLSQQQPQCGTVSSVAKPMVSA